MTKTQKILLTHQHLWGRIPFSVTIEKVWINVKDKKIITIIKDNNTSQEASLGIKELKIWDRLAEEIIQKNESLFATFLKNSDGPEHSKSST